MMVKLVLVISYFVIFCCSLIFEIVDSKMRVCVIGGGAAGLCAVRHLAGNLNFFEIMAFEQTDIIGGTWVYTNNTDLDDNGLPIHSSMYQNLRTNLPGEIMNFPDFQRMGNSEQNCLTHQEVLKYLQDYAKHYELTQYFQFNKKVELVSPNINLTFDVQVKNVKSGQLEKYMFDAVLVCNGHYSKPYIPIIPGIESFPGKILHSHKYRKPEDFIGETIIILGASYSGIDISSELSDYAFHVYLSHNNPRLNGELPSNITEVAGISSIENNTFKLNDGSSISADTFIYCTGYEFNFPFLHDSLGIKIDTNYVSPLYKQMININYPNMSVIGIPLSVVPFPLFHMQVQYFLAMLQGIIQLPEKSEMLEDAKLKTTKKKHAHKLAEKQWDYNDDLAFAGDFESLPRFYKVGYNAWNKERNKNIWNFKNAKFLVSEDENNVQIVHI